MVDRTEQRNLTLDAKLFPHFDSFLPLSLSPQHNVVNVVLWSGVVLGHKFYINNFILSFDGYNISPPHHQLLSAEQGAMVTTAFV